MLREIIFLFCLLTSLTLVLSINLDADFAADEFQKQFAFDKTVDSPTPAVTRQRNRLEDVLPNAGEGDTENAEGDTKNAEGDTKNAEDKSLIIGKDNAGSLEGFGKWFKEKTEENPDASGKWYLWIRMYLKNRENQFKKLEDEADDVTTPLTSLPVQFKPQPPGGEPSMDVIFILAAIGGFLFVALFVLILVYVVTCRKSPKKLDGSPTGCLPGSGLIGKDDVAWKRLEQDIVAHGLNPDQQFWPRGNLWKNVVNYMPDDLLKDKTVYVNPTAEKLVIKCTDRGQSVTSENSPLPESFYSDLLEGSEVPKTPAGLEDPELQVLGSDPKLRFTDVSLNDDEECDEPTRNSGICHI